MQNPSLTPLPSDYFEKKYNLSRTTLWRYRRAVGAKIFVKENDFVAFLERMNGQTVNAGRTTTKA
jgi:hypothetical protein